MYSTKVTGLSVLGNRQLLPHQAPFFFSEEGCMWMSCMFQWLEALRTVIAWRLYVALLQPPQQTADQEPDMVD